MSGLQSSVKDNDLYLLKPTDAPITILGALCAIMELKRSCNLSFSCIEKLLKLL